jgi:hypothetical protein
MDLEAFIAAIRPTIEDEIDAQIEAEADPVARKIRQRSRAMVIDKALDANRIAHLERRNRELEERLRPRLVDGQDGHE